MLNTDLASTIVTASITGAGLVLAIYALIIPISKRMLDKRVALLRNKKKEFDKFKDNLTPEGSYEDFRTLSALAGEIQQMKEFPTYLGSGVSFVFVCYIATSTFASFWLLNPNFAWEILMLFFFSLATIGFFFVGLYAIKDVHRTMKEEFEGLKKEQEEIEKERKKLKKLTEEIEKRAKIVKESNKRKT